MKYANSLRISACLLGLAACGETDDVDAPEVEWAVEDTDTPEGPTGESKADDPHVDVWATVSYATIESAHPYANNTRGTWDVEIPGARKLKLNFSRFETESQYDPVEIRDAEGRVVARYSGRRGGFTSAQIPGDFANVQLRSDRSVVGWGFRVETVEVYGLGCLEDDDCGEGYVCPQSRVCIQAPCFQTCEPDPDLPPAPPTSPPTQPPAPPTQPPAPPPGAPVSPWSVAGDLSRDQEVRHSLALPSDARNIQVRMTGTGDADLYTRFASAPTLNSYACRPYTNDSNEACSHARLDPQGPLHLLVRGYQAANHYALTVTWEAGAAPPPPPAPPTQAPAPEAELDVSGQLVSGQDARYQVAGRAGQTIVVEMTGTGDADLYVRQGAAPSLNTWECRPYADNANETCTVRLAADGQIHLLVHGYSDRSTYRLRTRR